MPRNWTHTLEERQAGLAPGFIGADESIEEFDARTAAEHAAAPVDEAPARTDEADLSEFGL